MATRLWNVFFNNKKMVSQCDAKTLGSIAEILVILFDQERYTNPLGGWHKPRQCAQAQENLRG